MKKSIISLVLCFFMFPAITSAAVVVEKGADRGALISGNDRYEAGSNVNLAADVAGDYFAAGGVVDVSRRVSQDVFAAGGTVLVSGDSGDDVRVAGGTIVIDSAIAGDLIVMGGQVTVKRGATIGGNLLLNGGNITYEGNTAGDAFINGGNVNLAGVISGNANMNMQSVSTMSGARIGGNLTYASPQNYPALENVTSGQKKFTLIEKSKAEENAGKGFFAFILAYLTYRFIFLLIFSTLLYFGFEMFFREKGVIIQKRPGRSILYGFLYFAAMPFLILLAFLTFIGIPIGFLLLFIYIFSFVFYKLITVTVFSAFIIDVYLKDKNSTWKKFGIIFLVALFITPWSVIDLIFAFFAYGALMQKRYDPFADEKLIVVR